MIHSMRGDEGTNIYSFPACIYVLPAPQLNNKEGGGALPPSPHVITPHLIHLTKRDRPANVVRSRHHSRYYRLQSPFHRRILSARGPPPYIVHPLRSLEVSKPENKSIRSTLSSIYTKVRLTSGSWFDAAHPLRDSPSTSWRFALGASNACLVGENLTCSVPVL